MVPEDRRALRGHRNQESHRAAAYMGASSRRPPRRSYGKMSATFGSMLDRLVRSLDAARVALGASSTEAGRRRLDEAFALLGGLYASLDSRRHPEMTAYLQFVYDACLQHIGGAGPGRCEGLASAIALLSALRRADENARSSAGPEDRPSFIARAIAV